MRRMFCGATIPKSVFATLHINSVRQAHRLVPSLVALPLSVSGTCVGSVQTICGLRSAAPSATELGISAEIIESILAQFCFGASSLATNVCGKPDLYVSPVPIRDQSCREG